MMEEDVRSLLDEVFREEFATFSKNDNARRKLKEKILSTNYWSSNGNFELEAWCKDQLEYDCARLRLFAGHYRHLEPKKAAEVERALRTLEGFVRPLAEATGYSLIYMVYAAGLRIGRAWPTRSDLRQEAPRHVQIRARKLVKHLIRNIAQELWSDPSSDDEWNSKADKRIGSMARYVRSIIIEWIESEPLNPESSEFVDLYRRAVPKNIEDVKAILKEHPSVVPEWALRGGRPKSK